MKPEIALVQAGAGMEVADRGFDAFSAEQPNAVTAAFPRELDFKHGIIDAFYEGMKHRPDSTFGTFNDNILASKDPLFRCIDMCSAILGLGLGRDSVG